MSKRIRLTAGVRQGGVLSPYLFSIFIDNLLCKLRTSSLGCDINTICMYADDLLLMSISITDLQKMVDLCISEFTNIDMQINVKTSLCIWIGNIHKADVNNIIIINQSIAWKNELHYLGVIFFIFKCSEMQSANSQDKIFSVHISLFSKVSSRASHTILLSLIDSYYIPLLSYGVEVFNVKRDMYISPQSAYPAAFQRFFLRMTSPSFSIISNSLLWCSILQLQNRLEKTFFLCRFISYHKFYIESVILEIWIDRIFKTIK